MSDKEWIEQIGMISNRALWNTLIYCGHDNYYDDIYKATVKEIKRRLDNVSSSQKRSTEDMTLKDIALELLQKYANAELTVIGEFSGHIQEEEEQLIKEVDRYKLLIEELDNNLTAKKKGRK